MPSAVHFYGTVDRAVAAIRPRLPADWPCGRGCCACCHQRFTIHRGEWQHVRTAVQRLSKDERRAVLRRARAYLAAPPETHPPCPLLDDHGVCRLYADRPLVCRAFGYSILNRPDGSRAALVCAPLHAKINDHVRRGEEVILADMTALARCFSGLTGPDDRSLAAWLLA